MNRTTATGHLNSIPTLVFINFFIFLATEVLKYRKNVLGKLVTPGSRELKSPCFKIIKFIYIDTNEG